MATLPVDELRIIEKFGPHRSVATGMRYRNIRIRCVSSSTAKP